MKNKVLYPVYGCQSVGDIMHHLKDLPLDYSSKVNLADQLKRHFAPAQFVITFDSLTGNVESVEPLKL
jgi:hypothetical protein